MIDRSRGKEALRELPFGWHAIGIFLLALFLSSASAQTAVSNVDSVGFTVSDMDRAIAFYTDVLNFEKVSDKEIWGTQFEHLSGVFGARVRIVRFGLGGEYLELTEYLTPQGRPIPVDSRSNDHWFQHIAIIVRDMDEAYRVLRLNKVRHASTGPQTLPGYIKNAAGIKAFYFKDFDNHVLEILEFPPDKGSAKWHELSKDGNKLFLGIDHTAIVVEDTDTSLGFYRDTLGLEVAGNSENYGSEQEHLNNVFGARLWITGLKTSDPGIAVEFLQYLAPTDGRPLPEDTKSSDLWHWQTSFRSSVIGRVTPILKERKFLFVSTGVIDLLNNDMGFRKAMVVRDPDGHAVRIVEN